MGLSFLQGIPLRKVLLQNYLFPNKKNNPKNDLAELVAAGKLHKGSRYSVAIAEIIQCIY